MMLSQLCTPEIGETFSPVTALPWFSFLVVYFMMLSASRPHCIKRQEIINWKKSWRKQSWPIQHIILAFTWWDCRKLWKPMRTAHVPVETSIKHLPNTNLGHYCCCYHIHRHNWLELIKLRLIILLVPTKNNFAQFSFLIEFYQSTVSPLKPLDLSSARSLAIHNISVLPTWSVMSEVRLGTVNHHGPYPDFLLNV
jgi:hypothetical protein